MSEEIEANLEKRLLIHFMSAAMADPDIAVCIQRLGQVTEYAKKAKRDMEAAIAAVLAAPGGHEWTREKVIAELVRRLDERIAENKQNAR